ASRRAARRQRREGAERTGARRPGRNAPPDLGLCQMRLLILLWAATASADEAVVIKLATVAPTGSPWARELTNFAHHVESSTHDQVKFKLYFNALAGDELEQLERMQRGQIDASASGQMACQKLAPTLRVARLPGVFQDRDEAETVLSGLRPLIDKEAHDAG